MRIHPSPKILFAHLLCSLLAGLLLMLLTLGVYCHTQSHRCEQKITLSFAEHTLTPSQGRRVADAPHARWYAHQDYGRLLIYLPIPTGLEGNRYQAFTVNLAKAVSTSPLTMSLVFKTKESDLQQLRPLTHTTPYHFRLKLEADAAWQGTLEYLALIIETRPNQPVAIDDLTLEASPLSLGMIYRYLAADWNRFEGLHHYTINRIQAGYNAQTLIPPIIVVMLWLIGASLVYYLLALFTGTQRYAPSVLLVFVLLAWIVLDLRWQSDLMHQHTLTQAAYKGVSREEKSHVDADAYLIAWARDIQSLPGLMHRRIFIASHTPSDYQALRLRWHLLPLPVAIGYPENFLQTGDIVIVLASDQHLVFVREFDSSERTNVKDPLPHLALGYLSHRETHAREIAVNLLMQTHTGYLFEVH